ncbi:SANT/Myb_domain [Hexamita inflata]|uniref:SANT/Myb_domain n=1 Tax=Hexamita inflata TaxID=28002 RepID=A0ABP1HHG3_9EUKA
MKSQLCQPENLANLKPYHKQLWNYKIVVQFLVQLLYTIGTLNRTKLLPTSNIIIMKQMQSWTNEDIDQFVDLVKQYHKDFRQIALEMNRTYNQVRSQYYNLHRKSDTPKQSKQAPVEKKNISTESKILNQQLQCTTKSSTNDSTDENQTIDLLKKYLSAI